MKKERGRKREREREERIRIIDSSRKIERREGGHLAIVCLPFVSCLSTTTYYSVCLSMDHGSINSILFFLSVLSCVYSTCIPVSRFTYQRYLFILHDKPRYNRLRLRQTRLYYLSFSLYSVYITPNSTSIMPRIVS